MKKPNKCSDGYRHTEFYKADEMDAYIAHLEQARDEAKVIIKEFKWTWPRANEWLSKYASEKVEGGGGRSE